MKKLLFLSLLFPAASFAQCDKLLGGDPAAAAAYVADAEKALDLKLTVDNQPAFIQAKDADGYAQVRIQYDMKNELKNGQPVQVNKGIKRIYIGGPWEKVEQMYNEYFLPKIKGCKTAADETTDTWEGHKLRHVRQGQQRSMPLGFIEITRN
ncbi:MAG: hypothetical protein EOO16_05275 [Chitinophagaceae bacterium]|nr:MAG: hypothetical protein EOO16_05275 [Chitinophagaceae bacterium]